MVINPLLLLCLLLFQPDIVKNALTVWSFLATILETRSHPPGKNIKDESYDYLYCLGDLLPTLSHSESPRI